MKHDVQALVKELGNAQQHPLINPDSPHYEMIGGVQAIEYMEGMFTTDELMAWSKITAMKYRLRIGDKDAVDQEAKKIKTYEAYYRFLEAKLQVSDTTKTSKNIIASVLKSMKRNAGSLEKLLRGKRHGN